MNSVLKRLSLRRGRRRQKPPPPPASSLILRTSVASGPSESTTHRRQSNTNMTMAPSITSSCSSGSSVTSSSGRGGIPTNPSVDLEDDDDWKLNAQYEVNDEEYDEGVATPLQGLYKKVERNAVVSSTTKSSDEMPLKELDQVDRIARAAAALDNAGNELFEKGDYDRAMASYLRALKLKRRSLQVAERTKVAGAEENIDYSTNSNGEQQPHSQQEQHPPPQKSEPKQKRKSKDRRSSSNSKEFLLASVATSINNIGYLRQRTGEATTEESMAFYKDALRIKQEVLGHDNLSFGKTLNNLGSVHYLKKEYDAAIEAYKKALDTLVVHLGQHHLDVGTVHSNLGDVYWAQRNSKSALEQYRPALEIRWMNLGEHDPKVVRLLEKIALIELKSSLLLDDSNHGSSTNNDDDEDASYQDSVKATEELSKLHEQVEEDMVYIDDITRKLAIDMVKDRLRLMRDMKEMERGSLPSLEPVDDDPDILSSRPTCLPVVGTQESEEISPPPPPSPSADLKTPSLSPTERQQALNAVKQRLARLRASRSDPTLTATTTTATSQTTCAPPVSTTTTTTTKTIIDMCEDTTASSVGVHFAAEISPLSPTKSCSVERSLLLADDRNSSFAKNGIDALRSLPTVSP